MSLEHNVGSALLQAARRYGNKPAIMLHAGPLSYASFGQLVHGLTGLLRNKGVGRGSCVAIQLDDPSGVLVCIAAASLLGAAWTDGKPGSLHVIAENVTHTLVSQRPPADVPTAGTVVVVNPTAIAAANRGGGLPLGTTGGFANASDMSRMGISSGSTGDRKAIWITAESEWKRIQWRWEAAKDLEAPTCWCMFPPKSGMGSNTRIQTLLDGGLLIETITNDLFRRGKVDMVVGSPAQLATFMRSLDQRGINTTLPLVMVGGSRPGTEFLRNLRKRFKKVAIFYGSTEMGNIAEYAQATRSNYDGRLKVSKDMHIEVVDDDGAPVPAGEIGHLRMKSDLGLPHYFDEETNARAIRDGWYYSGDTGRFSSDGYLFIEGRSDDTVNIGGTKVNILTYDDFVTSFDGVEDGYAFLKPDDLGVDRINLMVRFKAGVDPHAQATRLMESMVAAREIRVPPGMIYASKEVPRTDTGKPVRREALQLSETLEPVLVTEKSSSAKAHQG